MHHELRVVTDADEAADVAAGLLADAIRTAVASVGTFTMAVSGGRSPESMFEALASEDLPWAAVHIWQVDERIAVAGDPTRNLVGFEAAVGARPCTVHPMPVEELLDDDVLGDAEASDAVCARYAASLPGTFDLIHLGLGPDGHTASLVPGDAVLSVTDRAVAVTSSTYQDRRRMTMTYPTLSRTGSLLWLVTGADKRAALSGMLAGDRDLPASSVEAPRSVVVADLAACPGGSEP